MFDKKINSVRNYNKIRKSFLLCKDDLGVKLYPGDFIELHMNVEVRTPWISRIWWTPLDGAYVESHPTHLAMNMGSSTRSLNRFLSDKVRIPFTSFDSEGNEVITYKTSHSIKKVSYNDYLEWKKKNNEKN